MDPIEQLINAAIHREIDKNKNPYQSMESIIQRVYKNISEKTHVQPAQFEKTALFGKWHSEILEAYEKIKSKLSHEEKACVERVLSKDSPHTADLIKFASVWMKYDKRAVFKWFAVDGSLGSNPKYYVYDAFSTRYEKHNDAVRALYNHDLNFEDIKEIVHKAQLINEDEPCPSDLEPEFEILVNTYSEMVGPEEMAQILAERTSKFEQLQQPNKRKKTHHSKTLSKSES